MKMALVAYDLHKPSKHYKPLYAALDKLGGRRVLRSVWAITSSGNDRDIFQQLSDKMDNDDALWVVPFESTETLSRNAGPRAVWGVLGQGSENTLKLLKNLAAIAQNQKKS